MFDQKAYKKKWDAAHPNYNAKYKKNNPDKVDEWNKSRREKYAKDPSIFLKRSKILREKNGEKYNENRRIKYNTNEESREITKQGNRDSYQKFKLDRLKKNRQYKEEHWDAVTTWQNEYSKQWYQEHVEQVAANKKIYRKEHPEIYLKSMLTYLEKNAVPFNLTNKEYKRAITAWSRTIKKRDNYTCVRCGSKENCQAHHIKHRAIYPELSFGLDNGETLCDVCHYKEHGKKKRKK